MAYVNDKIHNQSFIVNRFLANIGLSIWLVSSLGGCVTTPPISGNTPQQHQLNRQHLDRLACIKQFSLKGRIAVNTEGKGYSGGLTWTHNPETDKIEMFSPLGSKISEIKKTDTEVLLTTSDGKRFNAVNAEILTENTLGWRLPLSGLIDWVLGRPAAKSSLATDMTLDELGRITSLKQDGWEIEYAQYSYNAGYSLPGKITLRSPKVNLKFVVMNWNSLNSIPLNITAECS